MSTLEFVVLVIGAYLVGSVPAAYLAAKHSRGIDLRKYGTGNVGLGNVWEMVSRRVSIPVILFDLGKGIAMVGIARLLGMTIEQQVTVAIATVVGHNWPVFLEFSGGRGILTSLGLVMILMPLGIFAFGGVASLTLLLKSSPLPVLLGLAVLPLMSWLTGQPLAITFGFLVLVIILVIRRLTPGRPAVDGSKKAIFLNRLLFDRDIRNREEWLYRVPDETRLTEEERARLEKKRQKKGLF